MFSRKDISKARSDKDVCLLRSASTIDIKWKDIISVYEKAKETDLVYVSFASLIINNTQEYTDIYNELIESLQKAHGGQLVGINSIVHLFSRNESVLNDVDGIIMGDLLADKNPHKVPETIPTYEELAPSIHIDRADGFFIQNEGSTLWTIYRDNDIKKYTLTAGDMMYIPKFTIHSVESLEPRHSTSIVFKDVQHFVCKHCGSLNT